MISQIEQLILMVLMIKNVWLLCGIVLVVDRFTELLPPQRILHPTKPTTAATINPKNLFLRLFGRSCVFFCSVTENNRDKNYVFLHMEPVIIMTHTLLILACLHFKIKIFNCMLNVQTYTFNNFWIVLNFPIHFLLGRRHFKNSLKEYTFCLCKILLPVMI